MGGPFSLKQIGSVTPGDFLSRNSPSSHLSRSEPLHPHPRPSPPPPKRRKVEDHGTHTQARFAPLPVDETVDRHTPRKRSYDNISDSQQTSMLQPSNAKARLQVDEFRHVEQYVSVSTSTSTQSLRNRFRFNPPEPQVGRRKDWEVDGIRLLPLDLGDSDGEVEVVKSPEIEEIPHGQQAEGHQQPIDAIGQRFKKPRITRKHDNVVDTTNTKRNVSKTGDSSPDELAPKAQDMREKMPTKRPSTPSPSTSISKRGNIRPTNFTASPDDELDRARKIIGERLRILRAVSGSLKYDARKASSADECFLKVGVVSTMLRPANLDGIPMEQYSYCTVNFQKVNKISLSRDPTCRIVLIDRSTDAAISGSPKLIFEFQSREELENFMAWARSHEAYLRVPIIDTTKPYLEKTLNNMVGIADKSTVLRDNDEADGADMKLMKHNRSRASQTRAPPKSQMPTTTSLVKTKDLMKPLASASPSSPKATVIPEESRRHNPPRQSRTTRSTFQLKDLSESPKLPEPDRWSVQNTSWEKQWRNSLVFPPHGKSRATVDKEDIPRLDEGEFLNDNLLTFYLRYLQHTLEATRPTVAQRIYFQNTYFYEKLKSPKASGGINYDSVKAWTSKVDLFTKDFIIVPINEFAHWYVAIIYNAPKLLPSSDENEVPDTQTADTITIEDVADSGEISRASSQSRPDGSTAAEAIASVEHNDVTNHLSPIDQENHKAEVQLTGNEQAVEEIVDGSGSRVDLEQIRPSTCHLPAKKAGKRTSAGPRKFKPTLPRIITLDSLALQHYPACRILKQYLIAELKDKKGLEIPIGALGMTAKDVPEQTNHCDCGLYLLGYIEEFLKDPDRFVHSLLQREDIAWNLNPSDLRNNIRDLIFKLQKEQQDREDAHKQEKRKAAQEKKRRNHEAERQVPDRSESVTQAEGTVLKEGDDIPTPRTKSPTPKSCRPEPKSVSDPEESRHIPGSFPVSPAAVRTEAKGSPAAANMERVVQSESPKFVSQLSETVSGSSPVRPVVVDDSEVSYGQRQDPTRNHNNPKQASLATDIVRRSPQHLQDYDEQYIETRSEKEAPITSRFFAGRQPDDSMPSARLREQPIHSDVIDISD
ncbi:cysteine proteinase [Hypoxylon cercidicola]|nr:cysteine proteinase [Hypoxylon cercidicola]